MTPSTDTQADDRKDPPPQSFHYDLRLEIGVKDVNETVPVVDIFRDLIKQMRAVTDGNHLAVLTATDKPYFEQKEMHSADFQKEFQVDKIEGKAAKVLLGFKIRTMTKLSDLKTRLIHAYLRPRNLFLREHVGGFENGVKMYSYGYLKQDHPDHKDLGALNQRFARRIAEAWRNMDKDERNKWKHELPDIFYGATGIMLPLVFTKERITASKDGEERIITAAIVVSTPSKFGKLTKVLLDAALVAKKINNLIPFALNRENQDGFYYLAAEQARFMENHRNIPISQVPNDANTVAGIKGENLKQLLNANTSIQRVAYDPIQRKCHISTTAVKYREVYQWIDNLLREHKFPYGPSLRPLKFGGTQEYGNIFKDAVSVATDTYSVNKSVQPATNAWKNRPPLDISYVATDASYPPLPNKKPGTAASTASETMEDDTIQSAISAAIKKLEAQHKAELEQIRAEFQAKMEAVENQMRDLGKQVVTQTYEALVSEDSPLATKSDQELLRQDIRLIKTQLSAMMEMMRHNQNQRPISTTDQSLSTVDHTPPSRKQTESKRSKVSSTPVKMKPLDDDTQDFSVSSAASTYEGLAGIEAFVHEQESNNIDIYAFSEHCLDTTRNQVTYTARQILRHTYQGQALIHLNSSLEPAINRYKPGGTGIQILGRLASSLAPSGRGGDQLGRWSYVNIRRRQLTPLTIISVYQVCPRPTNRIGNTAYHQQDRMLQLAGRQLHPRQAFMEDLQKFITSLLDQGHDIILGGDFNESIHSRDSKVLQLATSNQLVDPFVHKFPAVQEFGTHENGTKRIDSVLVTPAVLPSIVKVGYAPYDYSVRSDHRPLVIEFNPATLLGQLPSSSMTGDNRILKSKDKIAVKQFINTLYAALDKERVFSLQSKLDDDTATTEEVEALDHLIGDLEDQAEKTCRRRRPEYYSQSIAQLRFKVSILLRHLHALQKGQDRTHQLELKMTRSGIQVNLPITQALTKTALRSYQSQLQEARSKSFELRQAELAQRVAQLTNPTLKVARKAVATIRKVEANLKTYRIIQAMKKHSEASSSLDRVEVPTSWPAPSQISKETILEDPNTCTAWRTVTHPPEVEAYLLLRNRLHFGQAEGSPFTIPPLSLDINWLASSPAAEDVLQGTYESLGDISQLHTLVQECQSLAPLDVISTTLSMDDFRGKIQTWRESTTTSPSGRHLGRYKALFASIPEPSDEPPPANPMKLEDKQHLIAHLKLSMINYCLRNTHVLTRWKKVINVMILKEPGNFRIHRLRVLHLYEADYNALCAIQWRKLLRYADSKNLINEGQYGGRPGCEAQSLPFLEELKYDISYMTRRSLFNFDNDAKSCYDRIVVPLASLINRKYGLSRYIVALHAATLMKAQFFLKTANGISERYYSHNEEFPIHGTGQGSGNSPCIWLLISSTLYDAHARLSHGATFYSQDGTVTLNLSMIGFVDDATGSCNDFNPQTQVPLQDLFWRMTTDAQLWNDLLYCSGGKLELGKCSFHLLHFDFLPNGRPLPSLDQYDGAITLQDAETKEIIPIPSKNAVTTHKTLGHYKAPAANRPDITALQQRANQLSLLIAMSPITRNGARLAYHTVFLPTIKYTLPQSFYAQSTLDSAQALAHSRIIAKCGFNRNTARAIIYAPTHYAGGGFIPWYLLQGEGQIMLFLKHWRTSTIVSKALQIALSWAQWQSGYSTSILVDVHTPIPHLECRWLRSLREFLAKVQGQIITTSDFAQAKETRNDIFIMEYAQSCGLFTSDDLKIINYCRMYLHVTTVSELVEANGVDMIQMLFDCHREPWFNPETYVPLQRRPSSKQIKNKWQRLCREWFTSQGKLAQSINMGPLCKPGNQLRRRRSAYQETSPSLYTYYWRQGSYWKYVKAAGEQLRYTPVGPTSWVPTETCLPVTVKVSATHITLDLGRPRKTRISRGLATPSTFERFVTSLPPWEQHLLTGIDFHFRPYEILHRMKTTDSSTPLYLVSDGSQTNDTITYGWVCGNSTGIIYAQHSGYGYGTTTSHRAEAWGALSAILFLQKLLQYTGFDNLPFETSTVLGFSDNAGLVTRLNKRGEYADIYPTTTLAPDWDIVEQIHTIRQSIHPMNIDYSWVRGHQDEESDELTTEARYNIQADYLASQVQVPYYARIHQSPWVLPAEKCQLRLHHRSIHGHYQDQIRTAYTLPPLITYLQRRHNWLPTTPTLIDWPSFIQASRSTPIPATQLTKLVYEKLPTRYELSKANRLQTPLCPYCTAIETFTHLLQCPGDHSIQFRTKLRENLEQYLFIKGVHAPHSNIIWDLLAPTISQIQPSERTDPSHSRSYLAIHQDQKAIGYHLFLKGFMPRSLRSYVTSIDQWSEGDGTKRATDFLAGLIGILWETQMDLWKSLQMAQNSSQTPITTKIHDRRQECTIRIRLLHAKRDNCLASHRDKLFHSNVEEFLSSASLPQMRAYLHHYEHVILHSIQQADQITTRPLHTFPGFHRRKTHPPKQPDHTRYQSNAHGDFHHKHSRWKMTTASSRNITSYFPMKISEPPDRPSDPPWNPITAVT